MYGRSRKPPASQRPNETKVWGSVSWARNGNSTRSSVSIHPPNRSSCGLFAHRHPSICPCSELSGPKSRPDTRARNRSNPRNPQRIMDVHHRRRSSTARVERSIFRLFKGQRRECDLRGEQLVRSFYLLFTRTILTLSRFGPTQ